MDEASAPPELLDLTTAIVVAYAGSHTLPASELPELIGSVFGALRKLGTVAEPAPPAEALVPAVPVRKSVTPEYHGLPRGRQEDEDAQAASGDALRPDAGGVPAALGAANDYPMAAPAYAAMRSAMAKRSGARPQAGGNDCCTGPAVGFRASTCSRGGAASRRGGCTCASERRWPNERRQRPAG